MIFSNNFPEDSIGITSTVPIEIPFAAGRTLVDLNNLFISSPQAADAIKFAEKRGFPRNCCSWIKGIFGTVKLRKIKRIIFVTGGDCSNTHALMETLLPDLTEVYKFSFPYPSDPGALRREMRKFSSQFNVSLPQAENTREAVCLTREKLKHLDNLTWREGQISGSENFLWLLSSSDFAGDISKFDERLSQFLNEAEKRPTLRKGIRIGILGVPSIFNDLVSVVEKLGANVVFNEMPRQFGMLGSFRSLVEQYSQYSYPYGVWARIQDVKEQVKLRKIHGIIHYTQSFCHRQIHDVLLRKELSSPILTIEGENPGPVDQRTRLRIESFMEILQTKINPKKS